MASGKKFAKDVAKGTAVTALFILEKSAVAEKYGVTFTGSFIGGTVNALSSEFSGSKSATHIGDAATKATAKGFGYVAKKLNFVRKKVQEL